MGSGERIERERIREEGERYRERERGLYRIIKERREGWD